MTVVEKKTIKNIVCQNETSIVDFSVMPFEEIVQVRLLLNIPRNMVKTFDENKIDFALLGQDFDISLLKKFSDSCIRR